MNIFKTLMKRPQFLMVPEGGGAANINAAGNRCPNLLSPLRIRNVILKNRIMHTVAPNYLMQGPENFPSDAWRNHYSNMAKNAAIVSISTSFGQYPKTYPPKGSGFAYSWSRISNDKWEDIPPVHNYVDRMIEDIHCEGSLVLFGGNTGGHGAPMAGESREQFEGRFRPDGGGPHTQASKSVEDIVREAREAEDNGYEVYEMNTPSLEAAEAVRSETNLIIMASLRVGSRGMERGGANIPGIADMSRPAAAELEQFVESVRKLEGLADFVLIRSNIYGSWVQDQDSPPPAIFYAEAVKNAGLKIITCAGGGFHDPIQNDEFIASGKTEMVGMTMPLFADPDLVKKISAGQADDVTPCISCQNCHGISMTTGPYYATCDVNPKWAAPIYKLTNIHAPLIKKKVAVIGGGPAGMKAALVAAERDHTVTLYEKDASLGGLQKYTDYTKWVWPYKVFKDYLIHQVNRAGIEVKLNTTATPEMIKSKGYDTVLAATGAEPVISGMPGADGSNVFNILTCYRNKEALGKNVVMIGAGKFGTEAAISMVKDGHKVTVITGGKEMVEPENIGAHNMQHQQAIYQNHPDFSYILDAIVKSITEGKITYQDSKGDENSIQADSIVIYSGLRPRMDEAEKFIGSADEVLLLGDCTGKNGTLQKTIRSAFYVASQV